MRILVTGANGFVGRALCTALVGTCEVIGAVRRPIAEGLPEGTQPVEGELSENSDWPKALGGVAVVVHLAARVHILNDKSAEPLVEFRRINVDGTLNLARQAARHGVKRFIYVSSIGVNGSETFGIPFSPESAVAPHSPYAVSKYEAEMGLQVLARASGMEVIIIRPPLVYGPNAPGNFASLLKWLRSGIQLPLALVKNNRRSFVFLDNLVHLIVTCIDHPAAANQTFLVSDGENLSTSALLRRMGAAIGRPVRLLPVPIVLLKLGAKLLRRPDMAQRLLGSLEVDICKTRELLGWSPPIAVDEGLRRTAVHWIETQKNILRNKDVSIP